MRYILYNLEYKNGDHHVLGLIISLHISIEGIYDSNQNLPKFVS